jgi:hypothetical protein
MKDECGCLKAKDWEPVYAKGAKSILLLNSGDITYHYDCSSLLVIKQDFQMISEAVFGIDFAFFCFNARYGGVGSKIP